MKDTDILTDDIFKNFLFIKDNNKYILKIEDKKNLIIRKETYENFYYLIIGDYREDLFIKLYTVNDLKKVLSLFNY